MARATKREIRIEFDHDPDPDFSWLEQDQYNPNSREYSPTYASKADIRRKRPIDPEYYRDPDNHVALCMIVHERCNLGEWHVTDSLGNIDFLRETPKGLDDWTTGEFTSLRQIPKACRYQRQLAREAGLR